MKEDLHRDWSPFEEGREGTPQLLSGASAMCLLGYQGRQTAQGMSLQVAFKFFKS